MWNCFIEDRKKNKEINELVEKLRKAGMDEDAIAEVVELEKEIFKSDRAYYRHLVDEERETDSLQDSIKDETSKIDLSTIYEEGWIEEIENRELAIGIDKLNNEDKFILTKLFQAGNTEKEVAEMLGISLKAMSRKVVKIKKFLRIFQKSEINGLSRGLVYEGDK